MPERDAGIEAAKRALRVEMKARRAAIPPAQREADALRLVAQGMRALLPARGGVVSGFLSIGEEIATGPLLEALRASGCRLCLPVMRGRNQRLEFRAWAPGDPLEEKMWGIREPGAAAEVVEPTILLVPLLAFDAAGWRLGYGGGYYDRTLRALREAGFVRAIGLGFDMQRVDAVPHLDYDEPIDQVLTPSGLIVCKR